MSEDKDIWQAYAKSVKRVRSSRSLRHPGEGRDPASFQANATHAKAARSALSVSEKMVSADNGMTKKENTFLGRRTERQLRQGMIAIETKLDLHGMTQDEAYNALDRFMTAQVKVGRRNLLIITGKGSSGHSVLRSSLPQWLETLSVASHILDVRSSAPKHGGTGAFYVILKRRRD